MAPGYIIVWLPPTSVSVASAPNSTRPQSRLSPIIFDRMHLLFTQVHLLFDSRLGRRSICYRMTRGVGGVRKSIHQSWLAKRLGLGLLCWGFKGVQEEIPSEEASTLQIGSVAFLPGQCTSPQLAPCDFCLFPKLRGCRYVIIDERGCDEGHWHAHTDVVGTVQQVHCCRRRLLRRGLEFHVCTINKSAHTKKVWKLI